ncbi:uncharacterized protein L969DRAFT_91768 [Mixia osmundae IAM 14324]|uniref:AB hydrolase-1 domain-containing protein n=1 Tax=Mixia osmundae (strain CBS 9802 / IAM 14324 / JCM 22182 / KY 12970) TaxID=764103 RepID=G7EAG7_MIXOS|nr:uncharacterized protein L969DRAFT_91768 [Mixia osmundae IAM 14324]KEI42317.1 hypothetical protein L969DRAFT_91768 [Mixia osmundae IAM 14324]GAA99827.1 hypothetical protein E5Q_06530 [Mixia osmundae IAM 14324]
MIPQLLLICLAAYVWRTKQLRALQGITSVSLLDQLRYALADLLPFPLARGQAPLLRELHERYQSPVLRVGWSDISFSGSGDAAFDLELFKSISRLPKSSRTYGIFDPSIDGKHYQTVFTARSMTDWKHGHRKLSPLFRPNETRARQELFNGPLATTLDLIDKASQSSDSLDLMPALRAMASDITCLWLVDKPYGALDALSLQDGRLDFVGPERNLGPGLTALNLDFNLAYRLPWLYESKLYQRFRSSYSTDALQSLDGYASFCQTAVDERMNSDAGLVAKLLDGDEAMTREETIAQLEDFVFAGTDTLTATLGLGLYALYGQPQQVEALRNDLEPVFISDRPRLDALESVPLLVATVREILRIADSNPHLLEKELAEPWSTPIKLPDGSKATVTIPAGYRLGCSGYVLHRDKTTYGPDPERFDAYRWLKLDTASCACYQPFGRTPRACIAQNMATAVLTLVVADFVMRFDAVPLSGSAILENGWTDSFNKLARQTAIDEQQTSEMANAQADMPIAPLFPLYESGQQLESHLVVPARPAHLKDPFGDVTPELGWKVETFAFPAAWPRSTLGSAVKLGEVVAGDAPSPVKSSDMLLLLQTMNGIVERQNAAVTTTVENKDVWSKQKQMYIVVNRYSRINGRMSSSKTQPGTTMILNHTNGHHKEIWEPALAHLIDGDNKDGQRIDEIWSLDHSHFGDSALVNRGRFSMEEYNWADMSRDVLQFVLKYLPKKDQDYTNLQSEPAGKDQKTIRLLPAQADVDPALLELDGLTGSIRVDTKNFASAKPFRGRYICSVGHSQGSAAVLGAASCLPSIFAQVVGLDPVAFPPGFERQELKPLMGLALTRRDNWPNRDEAWSSGKLNKDFYGAWTDEVFTRWCDLGLWHKQDGTLGLKTLYPSEAIVFGDRNWGDGAREVWKRLSLIPTSLSTHIVIPKTGSLLFESTIRELSLQIPAAVVSRIESAHLMVQITPKLTADTILAGLVTAERARHMAASVERSIAARL